MKRILLALVISVLLVTAAAGESADDVEVLQNIGTNEVDGLHSNLDSFENEGAEQESLAAIRLDDYDALNFIGVAHHDYGISWLTLTVRQV
ncbi:MAG: hypothetical protein AAF197_09975, partial [Pseudomonadota bacterium]